MKPEPTNNLEFLPPPIQKWAVGYTRFFVVLLLYIIVAFITIISVLWGNWTENERIGILLVIIWLDAMIIRHSIIILKKLMRAYDEYFDDLIKNFQGNRNTINNK